MTISTVDASQRKAARVVGFTLLLGWVIVAVANLNINFRLVVPGNAVETARNILAHETLFRINVACNLIYVAIILALISALYVIFKPVNRNLALVATFCRLVLAIMWGITALNTLSALRLLGDSAYLSVFGADQLKTLARLNIAGSFDAYYVGLPFWGLASTVCSYLWLKSRYVPRALAVYGVISSGWCVICAFAFIVFPHFDAIVGLSWFDVPMVIFELALGLWLLVKGLKPSGEAEPSKLSLS
jgi:hypothetical protein